MFIFSTPELIRNLWQLKTSVFLHWCLIHAVPFTTVNALQEPLNKVMEQRTLRNVNNYLNTNIYSYLETSGGQRSNLYFRQFIFSTWVSIIHLWQLRTIVFLHWCLIRAVILRLKYSMLACLLRSSTNHDACATIKQGNNYQNIVS